MTTELNCILNCNAPEKKNVTESTQGQMITCAIFHNTSSFFSKAYTTKYFINISENFRNVYT